MSTFLEVVTSIIYVIIVVLAMVPVAKILEKIAGLEETDKDK